MESLLFLSSDFKDVSYNGKNAILSIIDGNSPERGIRNIVFECLKINGTEKSDKY